MTHVNTHTSGNGNVVPSIRVTPPTFYQRGTFGRHLGHLPMARTGSIRDSTPNYDRMLEVMS